MLHTVSDPEASSLALFVVPGAHSTHVLFETRSFKAQSVTSQVVSDSEASSPASFVVPAAHATQVLFETCSFKAQTNIRHHLNYFFLFSQVQESLLLLEDIQAQRVFSIQKIEIEIEISVNLCVYLLRRRRRRRFELFVRRCLLSLSHSFIHKNLLVKVKKKG